MKHYMKLYPEPFNKIRSGKKSIELRLFDRKRQLIEVDDIIEFINKKNKDEACVAAVTALHIFPSFKELYAALPLGKCGYDDRSLPNASYKDMEEYYSAEEQRKYDAVGIEFELLDGDGALTDMSRFLSKVLRHKPKLADVTIDRHGFADVPALIAGMRRTYPDFDMKTLERIVDENDKQRYSFNDDKTLIRANQGHSISVDVEPEELEPPEYLWHGTSETNVPSIDINGLVCGSRLYVHLSRDIRTAAAVGFRHGESFVYRVRSGEMYRNGYKFYRAANGVWLIKYVPAYYLDKSDKYEDRWERPRISAN